MAREATSGQTDLTVPTHGQTDPKAPPIGQTDPTAPPIGQTDPIAPPIDLIAPPIGQTDPIELNTITRMADQPSLLLIFICCSPFLMLPPCLGIPGL